MCSYASLPCFIREAHVATTMFPGLLPPIVAVPYIPPYQSEFANIMTLLNSLNLNINTDSPLGPNPYL